MRLAHADDISAVIHRSARGWHYTVHRGFISGTPTLEQIASARYGLAPTREQAYACALAEVRGFLRVARARSSA